MYRRRFSVSISGSPTSYPTVPPLWAVDAILDWPRCGRCYLSAVTARTRLDANPPVHVRTPLKTPVHMITARRVALQAVVRRFYRYVAHVAAPSLSPTGVCMQVLVYHLSSAVLAVVVLVTPAKDWAWNVRLNSISFVRLAIAFLGLE